MGLLGIGEVADLATTVINKFFPDKGEAEKAQLAATLIIIQGQLDANKVEAGNTNVFVSGWRPFVGWVCGCAVAWNWVGLPVAGAIMAAAGRKFAMAPADLTQMLPLLLGMLGLGGLRTIEKINGVAAK